MTAPNTKLTQAALEYEKTNATRKKKDKNQLINFTALDWLLNARATVTGMTNANAAP